MKVVFVNRFFHPDESATSQILSDLAFDLAARGGEVHVVTSCMRHDDATARLPAQETCQGVHVHRVWSSRFGRGHLGWRALDSVSFLASVGAHLLAVVRHGDIVVAKTDPPLVCVIAGWACTLRRAKLVNWLQDIFPEVAERLGVRVAQGIPGAILRWLRDSSLRQAVANVALGERMAQYVRERIPAHAGRVHVIENWSDGSVIPAGEPKPSPLRSKWGLTDRFVVTYSGNLGRVHEFDTLLGAFEQMHEDPSVVLLVVGDGPRRREVEEEVRRRSLTNVQFRPMQAREKLGESLSVADVHLVVLRPELEGLVVPSKLYGIAAAGRAAIFIGDPDGEAARILARNSIGYTVAEGDSRGLASLIRRLRQSPAELAAAGRRARDTFERESDRPVAVARWVALLENVAGVTKG